MPCPASGTIPAWMISAWMARSSAPIREHRFGHGARLCHPNRDPRGFQRRDIFSAILLAIGKDQIGVESDDLLNLGVLRAADPLVRRELVGGMDAEARITDQIIPTPQREKALGGARHQADEA